MSCLVPIRPPDGGSLLAGCETWYKVYIWPGWCEGSTHIPRPAQPLPGHCAPLRPGRWAVTAGGQADWGRLLISKYSNCPVVSVQPVQPVTTAVTQTSQRSQLARTGQTWSACRLGWELTLWWVQSQSIIKWDCISTSNHQTNSFESHAHPHPLKLPVKPRLNPKRALETSRDL